MNFRAYYRLNEETNYILMKNRQGKYQVIGPKSSQELPQAMQMAKQANNPVAIWTYNITGGKLNLPSELENDKENILHAHYSRMGFNQPDPAEERPEDKTDFSDIIDPSVFNPDYEREHEYWKKYKTKQAFSQLQKPQYPQAGTIDYEHPISAS